MKEINLNDNIWIKLNQEGKRIFINYWYDRKAGKFMLKNYTKKGWTRLQLHQLCAIFGDYMNLWDSPVMETTIKIGDELNSQINHEE